MRIRNSMMIISILMLIIVFICSLGPQISRGAASDYTASGLPLTHPKIVVRKAKRRMELYSGDRLVREYRVGLGFSPVGDKQVQGDGRTPEGEFYVCVKNPKSQYYLSLGLSYPNAEDAQRGVRDRLITRSQYNQIIRALSRRHTPPQRTRLGGDIYIHGNGSGSDWTWGCVALDDSDMKELFNIVAVGTPVVIEP